MTTVYYETGPYSDYWPYIRVVYNSSLKPVAFAFENDTSGVGAMDSEDIPLEVVEHIVQHSQ
jgi:hypothetical protein